MQSQFLFSAGSVCSCRKLWRLYDPAVSVQSLQTVTQLSAGQWFGESGLDKRFPAEFFSLLSKKRPCAVILNTDLVVRSAGRSRFVAAVSDQTVCSWYSLAPFFSRKPCSFRELTRPSKSITLMFNLSATDRSVCRSNCFWLVL